MSENTIMQLIGKIDEAKEFIKTCRSQLEDEIVNTDVYKKMYKNTKDTVKCTDKQAHKNAVNMAIVKYSSLGDS
jgi:hypothetical protein